MVGMVLDAEKVEFKAVKELAGAQYRASVGGGGCEEVAEVDVAAVVRDGNS
ncbi:hypothetical protein ACFWAY_26150 [Rhodococcus sp. NPDC059968]|uniref:hypothetical protein n=1 Tax=Rhodococcus sp. NPDC059968 TaxID=3347017 RepID=UPI00366DE14C